MTRDRSPQGRLQRAIWLKLRRYPNRLFALPKRRTDRNAVYRLHEKGLVKIEHAAGKYRMHPSWK